MRADSKLLREERWTDFGSRNVIVEDGAVHLWGLVGSESERKALIALAQEVRGVSDVADEMRLPSPTSVGEIPSRRPHTRGRD